MNYASVYMAPVQFHSMLDSGAATLAGALIKDSTSGRILAHVQETGLLQNLLGNVNLGSFSPLGAIQLAIDTANAQKLDRLMGMTQSLTSLSVAGLGVGLLGVGVSVASATMVLKRLNAVKDQISSLERKLSDKLVDLEWREYDRLFASAKTALEHGEVLAMQSTGNRSQWIDLAQALAEVANQAYLVARRQVQAAVLQLDVFEKIVLVQLLCRGAIVNCLMRANEVVPAAARAKAINAEHHAFIDHIDPVKLVQMQMKLLDPSEYKSQYGAINNKTLALVSHIRLQMAAADGQALLLQSLANRKANGIEFIERLQSEAKEPFLLINMAD